MELIIERVTALGTVKSKREFKLPKGKLLVTLGDKRFIINNDEDGGEKVERINTKKEENED